jgi:PKHD-type hydroxylase
MLLQIPGVLTADEVSHARRQLAEEEWVDGRVTAGYQSALAKNNLQLPEDSPVAKQLGDMIIASLQQNSLFITAALPLRVFPPLFNRYVAGQAFGTHVDNAIRQVPGTPHRLRTDVSATLFLSAPAEYEGGELIVEDTYGVHSIKLSPGDMILYPATSLHHVRPVSRGERIAAFFWIQSMVRNDAERTLLFDIDSAIQLIHRDMPDHRAAVQLMGIYHNLLRRWADI